MSGHARTASRRFLPPRAARAGPRGCCDRPLFAERVRPPRGSRRPLAHMGYGCVGVCMQCTPTRATGNPLHAVGGGRADVDSGHLARAGTLAPDGGARRLVSPP